jgi:hypothetical protein
MASKTSSIKEDSTLEGNFAKPSSIYESSIKKRDSTCSEKQPEVGEPSPTEKALEEAVPKYDESKILHGRRLFFAFVAMLLSVLLIALGAFSSSPGRRGLVYVCICRPDYYCPCSVRKHAVFSLMIS